MKFRNVVLLTLPVCSALVSANTFSQSTGGSAPRTLEEIVVTAQRREQSLQDVPTTVNALTSADIEAAGIERIDDIPLLTPNFAVLPAFTQGQAVYQMRGQIQTDANNAADFSVGVYFDDVFVARAAGALLNFVDIERVEVLKGPQGTLYGRNTTGGAVKVISKKPTDEFEGSVTAGYEFEAERSEITGILNFPLVNNVAAMRLVAQHTDKDGYFTNSVTGNTIDDNETTSARLALKLNPTEQFEILLQGDYTDVNAGGLQTELMEFVPSDGAGAGAALSAAALEFGLPFPAGVPAALPILCGIARHGCPTVGLPGNTTDRFHPGTDVSVPTALQVTRGTFATAPTLIGSHGADPYLDSKTWGVGATLTYDFGNHMVLKSITSYRTTEYETTFEVDGTALALLNNISGLDNNQISQEFILNGQALNDRLNWTTGAIYFKEASDSGDYSTTFFRLLNPLSGAWLSATPGDIENRSRGVFVHGDYAINDQWSFTLGARHTRDERYVATRSRNYSAGDTRPADILEPTGGTCTVPVALRPDPTSCFGPLDDTFSEVTYDGSVSYHINTDVMTYLRFAHGYRGGGFNPRVVVAENGVPFKPETVDEVELGFKGDWLGGSLRTNLAVFYDKYDDIQQTINRNLGGSTATLTVNAGKADVYGLEASIITKPVDWFTVMASLGVLESDLKAPAGTAFSAYDELPTAPNLSGSLTTVFELPVFPDTFDTALRLDYSYRDKMTVSNYIGGDRDAAGVQLFTNGIIPEYDVREVVNARVSMTHLASGIRVAAYVKNLLDAEFYERVVGVSGTGLIFGTPGDPREYGLEIQVPFGAR